MTEQEKRDVIRAFMDAWEHGDAEGVMRVMHEDATYSASVGPEPGTTYAGGKVLADGVAEMLEYEAGGESRQGGVWFSEDRAFAEWSYDDIADDGTVKDIRGIDVIHIVDGKIASIDAYRKTS